MKDAEKEYFKHDSALKRYAREAERAGISSPARQQRYIRARFAGATPDAALAKCRTRVRRELDEDNDGEQ